MRVLSRFESKLLHLLHAVMGRAPAGQALPIVRNVRDRPECLSRDAVQLVQQALAVGTTTLLVHQGGWKQERFLRKGGIARGRLWQRTHPRELGLTFTRHSLDFLVWLTSESLKNPWRPPTAGPFSLGDLWLFFRTLFTFRYEREIVSQLVVLPAFSSHGLCRLYFPEFEFEETPPELEPWLAEGGACILEVLQQELAERWVELEEGKRHITNVEEMRSLGRRQELVLSAFLRQAAAAGRKDLARFLLVAASRLFHGNAPSPWQQLDVRSMRMADRLEAYRAAAVLPRQFAVLQKWQQAALGTGFLDDDYQASQLWKADWEQWQGNKLQQQAKHLLGQIEPLAGALPAASADEGVQT